MSSSAEITQLLQGAAGGNTDAREKLLHCLYGELRELARQKMRGQAADHTLQPTALIHEAYIRLFGAEREGWKDRAHFLRAAAAAMRSVLIDHARARCAAKRGGGRPGVTLDESLDFRDERAEEILAVHEALTKLEKLDARKAETVEALFFGGLGVDEAAEALGVSPRTIKRDWRFARAWLFEELKS